MGRTPHREAAVRVAIVGVGPRGLSVLERLVAIPRMQGPARRLEVWTIDDHEPGPGRVWRVDQPPWLTMNTVAGQVTMYAAGEGLSLVQWARVQADPRFTGLTDNDYAPRYMYGHYLRHVYADLCRRDPTVTVHPVVGAVICLRPHDGGFQLELFDGTRLPRLDAVVLATGHARYEPTAAEHVLLTSPAGDSYVRGDSAADLPLDLARAGRPVGIVGLGLSFYDVLLSLTVGRGGVFHEAADGSLRYLPSGDEPRVVAGSRSGMPFPARGRNQKRPQDGHRPCFLTAEAIQSLRSRAQARTGSPQLDFVADIWPLLVREIQLVHDATIVRHRHGHAIAAEFRERMVRGTPDSVEALREEYDLAAVPPLNLVRLTRPFEIRVFDGPVSFRETLLQTLRDDLRDAARGNVDHPVKAALDVLRDMRTTLRTVVDFGGLRPASHREDFLGWFHPLYNFLCAGPPAIRVAQAVALLEAGVLEVCGPDTRVGTDPATGRFALESPQVAGSRVVVDLLIEARLPTPDVRRDTSPLMRQLLRDGVAAEFHNAGGAAGETFPTGGLAVDRATFRVVGADGRTVPQLYALGIPTEHTRWFTHMGGARPGGPSLFGKDADLIAAQIVRLAHDQGDDISAAYEGEVSLP